MRQENPTKVFKKGRAQMPNAELQKRIRLLRRDIGNLLFHFTRDVTDDSPLGKAAPAHKVLENILDEGRLRPWHGHILGQHDVVCFSEAPISELNALFHLSDIADRDSGHTVRYRPYGIAVEKEWLFAQGGRPVIYQPKSDYDLLPDSLKWRHVTYEPPAIDFAWEREWRIPVPVRLQRGHCAVVVPTNDDLRDLYFSYLDHDDTDYPPDVSPRYDWLVLELFGI